MEIVEKNYNRWFESDKVSSEDKKVLLAMTPEVKDDAFYCDIPFGTAGIRGKLGPGTNRMNSHTVKKVTIAYGKYILSLPGEKKSVVISHDNRHFSREFSIETARNLNKMGIDAYLFDALRPTPELSYAVRYMKATGGIMITASHNPPEWNGYKVYDEKGCQLVPEKLCHVTEFLSELPDELSCEVPSSENPGKTVILPPKVDADYIKEVLATQINPDLPKDNFKIVYTPQHGASYENAMKVFEECGYDVHPVTAQCVHDPDFGATLSPNPENGEAYIEPIKLAEEIDGDLIVMTDPDGDRCGLAYRVKKGEYARLTGNQSGALLIDYIFSQRKEKGLLSDNGVMYDTIVTSDLGRKISKYYGVKNQSFYTGFKYIGDRIAHYEEKGEGPHFEFGYEESYGCLIAPFVRDKDGIQAILLYSEMTLFYKLHGKTLGEAFEDLQKRFGYHEALTKSVFFEGSEGNAKLHALMNNLHENPPKEISGRKVIRVEDYYKSEITDENGKKWKISMAKEEVVRLFFEGGAWAAIRPSGTEPKCKFYVEFFATSGEGIKQKAKEFATNLVKELGA